MRDGKAKSLGRRVLNPLLGRPRLQAFFGDIYEVSLAAMGYGEGANPAASGEEGALRYVESRLLADQKVTIFDVGANVGQYAEAALDRWGERVALWCFEPSPPTFRLLSERLRGQPQVTLENLGLSREDGTLTLHTLGEGSKIASVYARRTGQWNLDKSEEIQVRTLDSYCAANRIDSIDCLKIDVEGHELAVLQGAKSMLAAGAIRFVQFEFSSACIDARVFLRDYWELLSKDYAIFRVIAHGLAPVVAYDETLEVFKRATNYLAERRPAP
jgi:FkbM family methyltransferase